MHSSNWMPKDRRSSKPDNDQKRPKRYELFGRFWDIAPIHSSNFWILP